MDDGGCPIQIDPYYQIYSQTHDDVGQVGHFFLLSYILPTEKVYFIAQLLEYCLVPEGGGQIAAAFHHFGKYQNGVHCGFSMQLVEVPQSPSF